METETRKTYKQTFFSFGKRKNNGSSNDDDEYVEGLLSWVWRSWRENVILSMIDPSLTPVSRNGILMHTDWSIMCSIDWSE
ncbi:hypothetical protein YC2023_031870 [Brassica napus]